jgi:hypothetical protein
MDELEAWLTAGRRRLLAPLEQPAAGRQDIPARNAEQVVGGRRVDLDRLRELDETPTLTLKDVQELATRRDAGLELSLVEQERLASAEAALSTAMKAAKTQLLGLAAGYEPEDRSPEAYRAEVEAYVAEAEEQAFSQRIIEAVQDGVSIAPFIGTVINVIALPRRSRGPCPQLSAGCLQGSASGGASGSGPRG